jgi:F0F1-type ATP synthase assembly protein I
MYTFGAFLIHVDKKLDQQKTETSPSDARYYGFAMRIVGDFGATIAVPAVLGVFLGVWLDKRFGTAPWLLILTLGMAFVLTASMIQQKAKEYGKKFEELNKKV